MSEADLVRKIIKKLKETFPGSVWYKIHTGPFQERGVPDILGCLNGKFIALEAKRPDNKDGASVYQEMQLQRIRKAGGKSAVVRSIEEALKIVKGK